MRVPTRRGEKQLRGTTDYHLTPAAIAKLTRELADLEKRRPSLADEVRRLAEMGDLSENAAYQYAKDALRRMNDRILILRDRTAHAIPIDPKENIKGKIGLGSKVTLQIGTRTVVYTLVGPQEAKPGEGRISYVSPVGAALMDHSVGEKITITMPDKKNITYTIVEIN